MRVQNEFRVFRFPTVMEGPNSVPEKVSSLDRKATTADEFTASRVASFGLLTFGGSDPNPWKPDP